MEIHIIRTDGSEVRVDVPEDTDLAPLIGAQWLDVVGLHNGWVMLVDDRGYESTARATPSGMELIPTKALKPVNERATALYHLMCIPGTTHQIVGDVVIVKDTYAL